MDQINSFHNTFASSNFGAGGGGLIDLNMGGGGLFQAMPYYTLEHANFTCIGVNLILQLMGLSCHGTPDLVNISCSYYRRGRGTCDNLGAKIECDSG